MNEASYNSTECLNLCVDLQQKAQRWGQEAAIAELMRIAVEGIKSDALVAALCRLLFVPKDRSQIRGPRYGKPLFLGSTSEARWPLLPVYLYRNIPFYIVKDWMLGGSPEPVSWYLAHCITNGIWNMQPFQVPVQELMDDAALDLITNGPWVSPLDDYERQFIQSQVRQ